MAQFERTQSSLSLAEEKLRRALRLTGYIGTEWEPIIRPVVIVEDAMKPGCNTYNNRSWMLPHAANIGAGGTQIVHAIDPQVDQIIDAVEFSAQNAADATMSFVNVGFWLVDPTIAAGFAIATFEDYFVELNQGERPGILAGNGGVTPVGAQRIARFAIAPNTVIHVPLRMHLRARTKFMVTFDSNNTVAALSLVNWYGRVF